MIEVVVHGRANGVAIEDGDRGDRSQRAVQRLRQGRLARAGEPHEPDDAHRLAAGQRLSRAGTEGSAGGVGEGWRIIGEAVIQLHGGLSLRSVR